jgi:hypothetical protein
MAFTPSELSGQDFLGSFLAEYLDGELAKPLVAKFEDALKSPGAKDMPEHFQAMRGRLQLAMQSYYLKEGELAELRSLVQDPSVKATQENVRIEQIGRKELVGTLLRRLGLVAVAVGAAAFLVWKFGPVREQRFKPLEYLGYEALALEEDTEGRLNLPSHDLGEIRQYLSAYPGLDFKPRVLKSVPAPWKPDGATVIDYEIAKVAVVMYESDPGKERLFHFSYAGELSDLPPAEPGNMRGLIFQTYASDELNLIAWQSAPGVVSLLVGRRSAPELAEIAVAGSGKS